MLTLTIALLGCAEGGAEEAITDATRDSVADATVPIETAVSDAPMIEEAPSDVPPGTIFDALDDAPCSEGSKAGCKTTCGTIGDVTCVGGEWSKCVARPGDRCMGIDCTGKGDGYERTFFRDADGDGRGDPKSTKQACLPPSGYVMSSDDCNDASNVAFPGATEVCDGIDNDCNGKIDELPRVVGYNLAYTDVPPCSIGDPASCKAGAYAWCKAKSPCYSGGFGPVELGPSEGYFVCVGESTLTGGWSDVVAAQPACSSDSLASKRVCESAVHRAGRAKGFGSAVLQTHAPSDWKFLGIPSSRAQPFDGLVWSDLTMHHAGCVAGAQDAYDCNAASHRFCASKGYVSGFGPVEYNDVNVSVVCVK